MSDCHFRQLSGLHRHVGAHARIGATIGGYDVINARVEPNDHAGPGIAENPGAVAELVTLIGEDVISHAVRRRRLTVVDHGFQA